MVRTILTILAIGGLSAEPILAQVSTTVPTAQTTSAPEPAPAPAPPGPKLHRGGR